MIPSLNTTVEINEMEKALTITGVFTIERTAETIKVTHTKSGKLVLQSLRKGRTNAWITRTHPKLWS